MSHRNESYKHEIINELANKHNNNWKKIAKEYNEVTERNVTCKNIRDAHHLWRKKMKFPPRINQKYDLKIINNLVSYYGDNWDLTHKNYCKITKTEASAKHLKQAYNRNKRKLEENNDQSNKKVKIDQQFEIISSEELEESDNNIKDLAQNIDNFIESFNKKDKVYSNQSYELLMSKIVDLNESMSQH